MEKEEFLLKKNSFFAYKGRFEEGKDGFMDNFFDCSLMVFYSGYNRRHYTYNFIHLSEIYKKSMCK